MKVNKIKNDKHYRSKTTSDFSIRLSDLILESKKPIKTLAQEIGIPAGSLSKYQNDNAEPGIISLTKISRYFNVSTDYLLGLTDVKTVNIDIQAISKKTGLSENAIEKLVKLYDIGNFMVSQKDGEVYIIQTSDFNAKSIDAKVVTKDFSVKAIEILLTKGTKILESIGDYLFATIKNADLTGGETDKGDYFRYVKQGQEALRFMGANEVNTIYFIDAQAGLLRLKEELQNEELQNRTE